MKKNKKENISYTYNKKGKKLEHKKNSEEKKNKKK